MDVDYHEVLEFWFAGEILGSEQRSRWWQKKEAVDLSIKQRFASLIPQVHDGLHEEWAQTPEGRLAAIICLDQFPRNIYRNSAKAFSFDDKALFLTLEGLNSSHDIKLDLLERTFFMMPLMHDESLDSQDRCVEFYEDAVTASSGELQQYLKGSLEFALRHREIIERFGRYPHRNKVLGRQNTAEEEYFLTQPGSSF
ncbi:DUF924 domain-containing protein [Endozoicomonas sp. Mp262]|uniref:DUF924 family protein n=1 Tax=Endozoicomonas sp. Mp262 TaxID=2919499 RepID=UPI0021D845C0